ncbi:MAG: VanW family protein [Acidimicrobiia bacterium]
MRRYIVAAAITVPLMLAIFGSVGYASDEMIGPDRISRGVTAAGIDLSRLTQGDATGLLASYEARLIAEPVVVIVEGAELSLDPAMAGFSIDEGAITATAMTVRRSPGLFTNIRLWFDAFTSAVEVPVPTTINEAALADLLDEWTVTVLDTPAYEGAVKISNGAAVPEYPQAGLRIDVEAATALIHEQLATPDRTPVTLPLVPLSPVITDADVDAAVSRASQLIDSKVVLTSADQTATIIFTSAGLATALTSEITRHSPPTLVVGLDAGTLRAIASRSSDLFVVPPVDATFTFDDETRSLSVVPSIVGQKVDLDRIPQVVIAAAEGGGSGVIPMTEGDEASFTTGMAEEMGPLGEVSTFTTKHPCCQRRVINIQLLADAIDGAIVMPGEEFSINERAGERTTAKGYVRAGAIIDGRVQCCDSVINIGGGTSQFATTFYNAVFFGCYEDVFHQPHSLYFSRYPFVREATLGFPTPDIIFRNDSEAIVYIHTEYTPSSITVTFFGNNGGRTCTSERSGNTITRVMEHPHGSITTQEWTWKYRQPKPEPTTTTTMPPTTTTTTTTPPTTTTTPPTTTTTTTTATTETAPP